jgi:hypothetical protein
LHNVAHPADRADNLVPTRETATGGKHNSQEQG